MSLTVLGIGASAGGLDALEKFLRHVPTDTGAAFVVVQHLSPAQAQGLLVELLQAASPIPVVEATDGLPLVPDHVYVIPPGKYLTLEEGLLRLRDPSHADGPHLSIDRFFFSLAADRTVKGKGLVLSGMGSDGSEGLRAIRHAGGLACVQDPGSASFDAMPRAAVATGIVEVMGAPEDLPGLIFSHDLRATREPAAGASTFSPEDTLATRRAVEFLKTSSGQDFSAYKPGTLQRRIAHRVGVLGLASVSAYVERLESDPLESDRLTSELLIGVTRFFRDATFWDTVTDTVFLPRLKTAPPGAALRAWVPACSTGEEAYSLAMCFREALSRCGDEGRASLKVFATDLSDASIDRARRGLYSGEIGGDVSAARLERFFVREADGFRVRKELRDIVVFATQNVLSQPPFTRLDVISCRNLFIYLNPVAQSTALRLFHYGLLPDGALLLGAAETLDASKGLFAASAPGSHIYRRLPSREESTPPVPTGGPLPVRDAGLTSLRGGDVLEARSSVRAVVERAIVERIAPPSVLVSAKREVLFVSGRVSPFLEVPAGESTSDIVTMARGGLADALRSGLAQLGEARSAWVMSSVEVAANMPQVDVTFQRLTVAGEACTLVSFLSSPRRPHPVGVTGGETSSGVPRGALEEEVVRLRDELMAARNETAEERAAAAAANEELQASGEELQSSNEELTTSLEELQSMNEELQTLNSELQAKIGALSRASDDIHNLLDSTEIAVVFLDKALNVRRFTRPATQVVRLIDADIGRPLADLAIDVDYPTLYDDAREVLRTLSFKEHSASTVDGRRFRVRIMPYRTLENRVDGVVITLTTLGILPVNPGVSEGSGP